MTRLLFIGLLLFGGQVFAQTKPATLFLVRHAERAGGMEPDVPISETGEERAKLLARMLGDAGVSSIVVSDAKRTQQTAAPLAAKLGLTPAVIKGSEFDKLVAAARALPPGSKALFVRHSNELGSLVEKLGGPRIAPVPDTEFDRFLVVILVDGKVASLSTLRYGR